MPRISKKTSKQFPEGFLWGAATAAYQVEGGIENCDWAVAAERGRVPKAGMASDHYYQFETDFDIAKELGHNAHRFSIEWARIEPQEGQFDHYEIRHYRNVLQALKARGLTPFVTLWHFTLPDWFEKAGGFANKNAPTIFARYCLYVLRNLHEDVTFVQTINEPMVWVSNGYLKGNWPPFKRSLIKYWQVIKNMIRSHNLVYALLKKEFPHLQIGIAKQQMDFISDEKWWSRVRADFARKFWNHRFLKGIQNYQDFIGVNFYQTVFFGAHPTLPKTEMGWDIRPEGIYKVLLELRPYGKPIYITENGIADAEDKNRAAFIHDHLSFVQKAIVDGIDVRGYFHWSLLDNFEWSFGFAKRFGLLEVDYDTMKRKVRKSAKEYAKICKANAL